MATSTARPAATPLDDFVERKLCSRKQGGTDCEASPNRYGGAGRPGYFRTRRGAAGARRAAGCSAFGTAFGDAERDEPNASRWAGDFRAADRGVGGRHDRGVAAAAERRRYPRGVCRTAPDEPNAGRWASDLATGQARSSSEPSHKQPIGGRRRQPAEPAGALANPGRQPERGKPDAGRWAGHIRGIVTINAACLSRQPPGSNAEVFG